MVLRSTLLLTLAILAMMLTAGTMSAYIGFVIGSQALRAITQPDLSTDRKSNKQQQVDGQHKGLTIIDEKEILSEVENKINVKQKQSRLKQQAKEEKKSVARIQQQQEAESSSFPLRDTAGGVTLEVLQAHRQGDSLLLDVNLKNEGSETVNFLYSFLELKDDRGRFISVIPDNLPGQLPANGQNFTGTLKIPTVLLDNAQSLSLTLTDYPAQKLELKLTNIPVTR
ncbi:hypothetical protein IQ238_17650 [Pleurocapsales cyanobacterium LEGE 06147]|nr:hypothetical protein [Pleurocapsales cyanobacterium LEGE 06147]